jgi:Asp-tRNA(Asn)/Glu-tRNA(Gln) amidotransferase C subunit
LKEADALTSVERNHREENIPELEELMEELRSLVGMYVEKRESDFNDIIETLITRTAKCKEELRSQKEKFDSDVARFLKNSKNYGDLWSRLGHEDFEAAQDFALQIISQ